MNPDLPTEAPRPAGRRFRPWHGIVIVAALTLLGLGAEFLWEGGLSRPRYARAPAPEAGLLRLDLAGLKPSEVRFYRYLNPGAQEVRFLIGRDATGAALAAFDASENDFKLKRGFRHQGEWLVNNKCDTAVRLEEVNQGGGCRPVPLRFRLDGQSLVIAENDLLEGWRYFR